MRTYEHRFLLRSCDLEKLVVHPCLRMSQGYLQVYDGERSNCTAWVRITDDLEAILCVTDGGGVLRQTHVQDISFALARLLMELSCDVINKYRYIVPDDDGRDVWAVDRYPPPFDHVIVADIELQSPDAPIPLLDWFGSPLEVTDRLCTADIAHAMSIVTNRSCIKVFSQEKCERFADVASLLERPRT